MILFYKYKPSSKQQKKNKCKYSLLTNGLSFWYRDMDGRQQQTLHTHTHLTHNTKQKRRTFSLFIH